MSNTVVTLIKLSMLLAWLFLCVCLALLGMNFTNTYIGGTTLSQQIMSATSYLFVIAMVLNAHLIGTIVIMKANLNEREKM